MRSPALVNASRRGCRSCQAPLFFVLHPDRLKADEAFATFSDNSTSGSIRQYPLDLNIWYRTYRVAGSSISHSTVYGTNRRHAYLAMQAQGEIQGRIRSNSRLKPHLPSVQTPPPRLSSQKRLSTSPPSSNLVDTAGKQEYYVR